MSRSLNIGIVYELLGSLPQGPGDPADVDVEYEPEATIEALEGALLHVGHRPVRIGSPHALLAQAGKGQLPRLDAVLNLAEGRGTRNREAWAPVLLDMLEIPFLGSDAATLSASLDKSWAKALVARAGVAVPAEGILDPADLESASLPGPFPLFVKPRWEGSAKGIHAGSRVEDREALGREVRRIRAAYDQPALVEVFLEGSEFTVTVIGNDPAKALPVLQRALDRETGIGVHALAREPAASERASELPGVLTPELEASLATSGLAAYAALDVLDFARADFRLDARGRPHFLEINPLPTFAPEGTFGILAELEGRTYADYVGEILCLGLARLGLG